MILGEVSLSQIMRDLGFHDGKFGLSPIESRKHEMLL